MNAAAQLTDWHIHLEGRWTPAETARIFSILQNLTHSSEHQTILKLFNQQNTYLHHSSRPGKVGRTSGAHIYLDNEWTDWTLAHELGHRWNNAWERQPEHRLRQAMRAGKLEWLKHPLRKFEKYLERQLKHLGPKVELDWRALWYDPGKAPPPCGVDRNFNASEDLAETFAASIFQENARTRAYKAADRLGSRSALWDWGKAYDKFQQTPRGKMIQHVVRELLSKHEAPQQTNRRTSQD